ncbi:Uncharacterised protein [Mycobacteroides abscessus subsp. abscessus]|uniref:hypothetical protein n=1 Tax=Mycobacteroides abscessus TaxID=36809 RepID=UPI0009A5AEB3|nr:hypothetical protein [Mycobacteroides abscessus]MBN7388566.1 hypothetical protein [Mycobacteroides abscessus subsp. abscessus]MBN7414836.1 hypothetical protein [Mycobacteroides abscessus subsp. abscessus]MDO2961011.1 hypothetical protein [Mycobacteroides abscessus subsp. abscessus]MDO2994979.1 hypothetical protein [Mycobacteroides abscessus subsp. abscessus]MDO3064369.1 hypothetical protein [Mycobacteroides abscessus subsp. abscessus]
MNKAQHEAFQAAYARSAERSVAIAATFFCIEALNWTDRPTAHEEFVAAMDELDAMRAASNAQLEFEVQVAQGHWDDLLGKRP